MTYRLQTERVEVEDIDILEWTYAIEALGVIGYYLDKLSDQFYPRYCLGETDEILTEARRAVYAIGVDLKRVLRGRPATSALGQDVLSPILIEMIEWVAGQYIEIDEREDPALRLASRLRQHLSLANDSSRLIESYKAQELKGLFNELKTWAQEIEEYLTDSETYLMGGWDAVHEMLGHYDGQSGCAHAESKYVQGTLFDEDALLIF